MNRAKEPGAEPSTSMAPAPAIVDRVGEKETIDENGERARLPNTRRAVQQAKVHSRSVTDELKF